MRAVAPDHHFALDGAAVVQQQPGAAVDGVGPHRADAEVHAAGLEPHDGFVEDALQFGPQHLDQRVVGPGACVAHARDAQRS